MPNSLKAFLLKNNDLCWEYVGYIWTFGWCEEKFCSVSLRLITDVSFIPAAGSCCTVISRAFKLLALKILNSIAGKFLIY